MSRALRWVAELDAEGGYMLRLNTPIGPHYVTHIGQGLHEVVWYPFDTGDGVEICRMPTEELGLVAAESNYKVRAAKLKRSLK